MLGLLDWTMPASEKLANLTLSLDRRIARSPSWPKTPAILSNELRRLLLSDCGALYRSVEFSEPV